MTEPTSAASSRGERHDTARLERIQGAVSFGRDKRPESQPLIDMEWLAYELMKAWGASDAEGKE